MTDFLERISSLSPKRLALLALEQQRQIEQLERKDREPIAVIGMGCRFPGGANDADSLWELLRDGKDAVVDAPADRWGLDRPLVGVDDKPWATHRPQGGFLDRVDLFDPLFFGISPREAVTMDPQQRLLLEVAWEALENAGIASDQISGSHAGVFLGIAGKDFAQRLLDQNEEEYDSFCATGGSNAIAAGRLAYTLGLNGPCVAIDTACSSSLVALCMACDSLRAGRSTLALAGGVSLILSPETSVVLAKAGMLSADFRCKTFDAAADGFVRGEGCGLVVLKRLADAERDGDRILSVIRGTAINQDGRSSGLTAPNGPSQQALIREALSDAGIAPSAVQYVEAHGTGTSLGDPIEVQALAAVYGAERHRGDPLWVGSIKSNFGHTEAAAGIAGFLKLVLALERGAIPPLVHLQTPNSHVDWKSLPLALPTSLTPWPGQAQDRIGGVSSFGFSGTNAHVLVSAAPQRISAEDRKDRPLHVLCLSARSDRALRQLAQKYASHLAEHQELDAGDIAFTANRGRAHFSHRTAVLGDSRESLVESLSKFAADNDSAPRVNQIDRSTNSEVVFLFTGQGSQYAGMARELYDTEPTFRAAIERCQQVLSSIWDRPLTEVLFPRDASAGALVNQTQYTQPSLFAVEFALAELLRSWGIKPAAALGHSIGEYVAACVAGVFSLEQGLGLVAARASLMQSLPAGGGMLAVLASEEVVAQAIAPYPDSVSIAALNGPTNTVIAGRLDHLAKIAKQLESQGIASQPLAVSHAFHSPLLEPVLDDFEDRAARVAYSPASFCIVSNLTGKPAKGNELAEAGYWRAHARQAVRFEAGIRALREMGYTLFLEIGPNPILTGMTQRFVSEPNCRWLPTMRRGRSDWQQLLESLAGLYTAGAPIDWEAFDRHYSRRKVALPTYPFERSRYWPNIELGGYRTASDKKTLDRANQQWLYEPKWKRQHAEPADPLPADYLPTTSRLNESVSEQALSMYGRTDSESDLEAYQLIDEVCTSYILRCLAQLGCDLSPGTTFSGDDLQHRLGVLPRYQRLLHRFLEILCEDGILRRQDDAWQVVASPISSNPDELLGSAPGRFPQCAAEFALLAPCGQNLAAVLRGQCDPMQLLFPDGSLELATNLYSDARPAVLFNAMVERCFVSALDQLPSHRSIRILEIGAGTGGTTARLLPHLPRGRTSYVFTDVSNHLLANARTRFGDYPFVDYRILDIEKVPESQGLALGSFDVIVAANVVHATRDLRTTLSNIRRLLKPGGLFMMLEVIRRQRFGDLTVGLTDGWWAYADTALRPDYPLLPSDRWLSLLTEQGFEHPTCVPGQQVEKTGAFANQSILLARAPTSVTSLPDSKLRKRWLLWVDEGGEGRRLAAALRARGDECLLVRRGPGFKQLGGGEYQIAPDQESDFGRMLAEYAGAGEGDCCGAVYLWGLDGRLQDDSFADGAGPVVERCARGALYAAQALISANQQGSIPLTLVTRGAQSNITSTAPIELAQTAVWGLGRTIALEHPELRCVLVDLDHRCDAESTAQLAAEVSRREGSEGQIALRDGARYVLRLAPSAARDGRYSPPAFSSEGCYLITGGLSGLGLETARWLATHGARHLVLVGRNGANTETQQVLTKLERGGTNVVVIQGDVADEADCRRIFAAVEALSVPLRGIFHSAGALDDSAFVRQDWQRFENVLRAKVLGAWNLHRMTLKASLDYFVLYSSGASLLGSAGQANHATANAFLDGLAHFRRSLRLPALSINWGAWSGTGAALRGDTLQRMELTGLRPIDVEGGLQTLAYLMAFDSAQVAVLPMDWHAYFERQAAGTVAPLLEDLKPTASDAMPVLETVPNESHWQQEIALAAPAQRNSMIHDLVRREAARVLGIINPQSIDSLQPLQELGLDSLMAVQFRNTLARWSAVDLPATLLYSYPTLIQLTEFLDSRLSADGQAPGGDNSLPAQSAELSDAALDSLSEEDLVRLLEQEIESVR